MLRHASRIALSRGLVRNRPTLAALRVGPAPFPQGPRTAAPMRWLTTPQPQACNELKRLHVALLDAFDQQRVSLDADKLTLELPDGKGSYSLYVTMSSDKKHEEIMLASPVSGARWYQFDEAQGGWVSKSDGHNLVELLVREYGRSAGVGGGTRADPCKHPLRRVTHLTARYIDV